MYGGPSRGGGGIIGGQPGGGIIGGQPGGGFMGGQQQTHQTWRRNKPSATSICESSNKARRWNTGVFFSRMRKVVVFIILCFLFFQSAHYAGSIFLYLVKKTIPSIGRKNDETTTKTMTTTKTSSSDTSFFRKSIFGDSSSPDLEREYKALRFRVEKLEVEFTNIQK